MAGGISQQNLHIAQQCPKGIICMYNQFLICKLFRCSSILLDGNFWFSPGRFPVKVHFNTGTKKSTCHLRCWGRLCNQRESYRSRFFIGIAKIRVAQTSHDFSTWSFRDVFDVAFRFHSEWVIDRAKQNGWRETFSNGWSFSGRFLPGVVETSFTGRAIGFLSFSIAVKYITIVIFVGEEASTLMT